MKKIITVYFLAFFCLLSKAQVPESDSLALVALYQSTNGDFWTNNSNWLQPGQPVSTWYGVTVKNDTVTGIDLSGNILNGTIPSEIGDLSNLQTLDLGWNELGGTIPAEIGDLDSLKVLDLHLNDLSGSIPAEIGDLSNLQTLDLCSNELSDSIPAEIGDLSNLQTLNLRSNQLSRSIPAEIGSLTNLQYLGLHDNELSGSIPAEIGDLSNLQTLDLWNNELSDSIPVEIGYLSNLQTLNLRSNQLSGSIPAEIGDLDSLKVLDLDFNDLSGSIPAEIGDLSNLQTLSLGPNELSGTIPVEIGDLSNLQTLSLGSNELSGSIPVEIGDLSNLQTLSLKSNELSGSIPAEIGDLSNLQTLDLRSNELSGSISAEIGSLTNLRYLYLSTNQLSGSIPAEIGDLSNLQTLDLRSNELSGSIPAEIGDLSNLQTLDLAGNELSDSIPTEIGSLINLQYLYLDNNKLCGSIPAEIGNLSSLKQLYLIFNQLSGNIPSEILNLSLNIFDLAYNNYTFSDLDSVTVVPLPAFLRYSPQNQIPVTTGQINKKTGDNLELNIINLADNEVAADSNRYQWWKGSDPITAYSSSPVLNITDLDASDQGYYYCSMINPEFPLLTLYTDSLFLGMDSVPFNITLTPDSVDENVNSGTVVGILSAEDIDQTTGHIFTLTDGNGINDADNGSFSVSGENLIINTSPDYETKDEYYIYVRATDDDLNTFDKALVVYVNDIDEPDTTVNIISKEIIHLFHIYPNPFTYTAIIEYTLPKGSDVEITLYDLTGRIIKNLHSGHQSSGIHTLNINTGGLGEGVYLCRIKTELYDLTRKCVISE